jgi:hypothetical protein
MKLLLTTKQQKWINKQQNNYKKKTKKKKQKKTTATKQLNILSTCLKYLQSLIQIQLQITDSSYFDQMVTLNTEKVN